MGSEAVRGVRVQGPMVRGQEVILTPEALAFVGDLVRRYRDRIVDLLARRQERQRAFDAGERPAFLETTKDVREGDWRCAAIPADLQDRRVEITGPCDRKMVINALNSGARVFMADFEDSTAPTWPTLVTGQINLRDAVRGDIRYVAPDTAKTYALAPTIATLMVRPRGLHLPERHVLVDGRPAPGALVDFGLFFFHNAHAIVAKGGGPYFYLPKLESHLEARLWNDIFVHAQEALGLPRGTIRATVLIETLPAAFEMDEILYELRDHAAGLNCGRWDYIFSYIKKLRLDPACVLPDRSQVTLDKGFLQAYVRLLIATCHRRGVHAMGGMAAQIPIRGDDAANERALAAVRADKLREVRAGHDGTWVAHPGLVAVAKAVFDEHMPTPNQIAGPQRHRDTENLERRDSSVSSVAKEITAADLVEPVAGTRTEAGLRHNIRVGVQYLESWLRGTGCVPLYHLMEDAATAEICRAQVWQWLHHEATLDDGSAVDVARVRQAVADTMAQVRDEAGDARVAAGRFDDAEAIFTRLVLGDTFVDFLTLPAYDLLSDERAEESAA